MRLQQNRRHALRTTIFCALQTTPTCATPLSSCGRGKLCITSEGLRIATDKLDSKNFYAFNPEFDKPRK